jgi:hypothetical protein
MIDLSHIVREKELGILAIVSQFSDFKGKLDFEDGGKEGIFLFHGHSHQAIPYPYDYEVGELNAEMLLLWGRRTVINVEIPQLEGAIKEIKEAKEEERVIEFYERTLEEAKEERDIVHEKFSQAKTLLLKAREDA